MKFIQNEKKILNDFYSAETLVNDLEVFNQFYQNNPQLIKGFMAIENKHMYKHILRLNSKNNKYIRASSWIYPMLIKRIYVIN